MIMSPSLERGTGIIGVLAVYLYELVEHTSCEIEVFIAEMLTQNQKDLFGVLIGVLTEVLHVLRCRNVLPTCGIPSLY